MSSRQEHRLASLNYPCSFPCVGRAARHNFVALSTSRPRLPLLLRLRNSDILTFSGDTLTCTASIARSRIPPCSQEVLVAQGDGHSLNVFPRKLLFRREIFRLSSTLTLPALLKSSTTERKPLAWTTAEYDIMRKEVLAGKNIHEICNELPDRDYSSVSRELVKIRRQLDNHPEVPEWSKRKTQNYAMRERQMYRGTKFWLCFQSEHTTTYGSNGRGPERKRTLENHGPKRSLLPCEQES